MKPENKAVRTAMKKAKDQPSLHSWQRPKHASAERSVTHRKTKKAFQYETYDDDVFIGYTYIKGGSR